MLSSNYFEFENAPKATPRRDGFLHPEWTSKGSIGGATASGSAAARTPENRNTMTSGMHAFSESRKSARRSLLLTPGGGSTRKPVYSDRHIPSRSASSFDTAAHSFHRYPSVSSPGGNGSKSPSLRPKTLFQEHLEQELGLGENKGPVFSYCCRPSPARGDLNPLKVIYRQGSLTPTAQKSAGRLIYTKAERILDAPGIDNDFYLHLLDWSCDNLVSVALSEDVYVWNAGTSEITKMADLTVEVPPSSSAHPPTTACCIRWMESGSHLAVGASNGEIFLYDVATQQRIRRIPGSRKERISCLAWNEYILTAGDGHGFIRNFDVRSAENCVSTLRGARDGLEVCTVAWSSDKKHLAAGGNDNTVRVWTAGCGSSDEDGGAGTFVASGASPLWTITEHTAAVKGLAWCPWRPSHLVTGGGLNDRTLRLWTVASKTLLKELDVKSQVASIVFNEEYKELAVALGHTSNQILLLRHPNFETVATLEGHEARCLDMAIGPDQTTIVTAGADETLRLWKCFEVDAERRKAKIRRDMAVRGGRSVLEPSMR